MSICIEVLKRNPTKVDLLEALNFMLAPNDKIEIKGSKKYYLNSFGDFLIHILKNNLTGDEKLDINPLLGEIDGFKNDYYFRTILKCNFKETCTLSYANEGTDDYFKKYGNFWNTFDFSVPILKVIPYKKYSMFEDFTRNAARKVIFTRINPYYVEIYLSLLVLLDHLASKIKHELNSNNIKPNKFFSKDKLIVLTPYLYISDKNYYDFKSLDGRLGLNILNTYECYSNLYNFLNRFNYFAVKNVLADMYYKEQIEGKKLIPSDKYNNLTFNELCSQIKKIEDKIIETRNKNYNPFLEDELRELYEVELEMNVIEAQIENQSNMFEYMRKEIDRISRECKGFEKMFSTRVPSEFRYIKDNFDSLTIGEIREFAINTNMYSYRNYIPSCKEVVFINYSFENNTTLDEVTGNGEDIFIPKRWIKVDFYETILEDYHFDLSKHLSKDIIEDNIIDDVNPEFILPEWYKENYSEYMVSVGEDGYADRGYLDFFFEPREKIYSH